VPGSQRSVWALLERRPQSEPPVRPPSWLEVLTRAHSVPRVGPFQGLIIPHATSLLQNCADITLSDPSMHGFDKIYNIMYKLRGCLVLCLWPTPSRAWAAHRTGGAYARIGPKCLAVWGRSYGYRPPPQYLSLCHRASLRVRGRNATQMTRRVKDGESSCRQSTLVS
jgi:hypothetical protein